MEKVPPAIPFEEIYAGTELHDEAVEALLEEGLDPRGPDMLFDLAGELGLARGQLVVDVGCGDGKKARELAKRFGCRVIGVEPIRANLERRQREPVETELVTFVQGRIEAIPLPYATADLVWARDMLVHVPDLVAGLRECRRVLKRDGRLLAFQMFATPWLEPAEASRLWPALAVLPQNVDPEHFEASAQAAGLTVARREEVRSEWREWEEEQPPDLAPVAPCGPAPPGSSPLHRPIRPDRIRGRACRLLVGRVPDGGEALAPRLRPQAVLGLKASKGLRQARQKCVVRQSVGPNALSRTVVRLPQNGQGVPSERASEANGITTGPPEAPGGVIPYERRATWPSAVMRSLVQGGPKTTRTRTSRPSADARTAASVSSRITSRAGHPAKVGSRSTSTASSVTTTRSTIPRSVIEHGGISGSWTPARLAQTSCSRRSVSSARITSGLPDGLGTARSSLPRVAGNPRNAFPGGLPLPRILRRGSIPHPGEPRRGPGNPMPRAGSLRTPWAPSRPPARAAPVRSRGRRPPAPARRGRATPPACPRSSGEGPRPRPAGLRPGRARTARWPRRSPPSVLRRIAPAPSRRVRRPGAGTTQRRDPRGTSP